MRAREAGLLSANSPPSYFFAIVLIIGIVASNAFHPGMWQRVYTVQDQRALNRSLWGAVAIAIPLTFLMGMSGIAAVGNGSVEPFGYPAVAAALFALASDVFPLWMHFLMLVCALMLAMSTLDTLMNGIASGIAADFAGFGGQRGTIMALARAITVIVAIPAIIVGSQGYSVLYVFLIADLLGAALAVPVLVGLYSRRMPGWGVLAAGGVGIIIGALYYPKPDLLSPWALTAPAGGQMFWSFAAALVISTVLTAVIILVRRAAAPSQEFDFEVLDSSVNLIDSPAGADD